MNVLMEVLESTARGRFSRLQVGGSWIEPGAFECFTGENPWKNNLPYISCIPEGTYNIVLGTFHRGGYPTYEILDVPGRTLIKFHRGTSMLNVWGCIAMGMKLEWAGVSSSKRAHDSFMEAMNGTRVGAITIASYKPEETGNA